MKNENALKNLKLERGNIVKEKRNIEQMSLPEFLDEESFNSRMEAKCEANARLNTVNAFISAFKNRCKL